MLELNLKLHTAALPKRMAVLIHQEPSRLEDLDFESLKPLDPLLQNIKVAVANMVDNKESAMYIPNAFMASVPFHSFWWFVLRQAIVALHKNVDDIFTTTGPVALRDAVAEYQGVMKAESEVSELTILPFEQIYGVSFDWGADSAKHQLFKLCHLPDAEFNASRCKENVQGGYAITYWSGVVYDGIICYAKP